MDAVGSGQEIVLIFVRHVILRKKKGFIVILEYRCPGGKYLYEFMVEHIERYYLLADKQMNKDLFGSIDLKAKMVG